MATKGNKLIFENNEPEQVALKFAEGKLVPSTYGDDQWFFSLAFPEGLGMYVDGLVAARIKSLGVQPGERFWIAKRKIFGKGGGVTWDVWRGEKAGPVERRLEAEGERSPLARSLGRSLDRVSVSPAHGELVVPIAAPAAAAPAPETSSAPARPSGSARARTQLEDALLTAVAACHAAQNYAREIGYAAMPQFTGEDLRCMVNTILINQAGGSKQRGAA